MSQDDAVPELPGLVGAAMDSLTEPDGPTDDEAARAARFAEIDAQVTARAAEIEQQAEIARRRELDDERENDEHAGWRDPMGAGRGRRRHSARRRR